MAKKKISYREAIAEIETIIREIDTEEIDLDEIQEKIKRFKFLMEECQTKLKATEKEIDKLQQTD